MVRLVEKVIHSHCHHFFTSQALSSLSPGCHHLHCNKIVLVKLPVPSMLLELVDILLVSSYLKSQFYPTPTDLPPAPYLKCLLSWICDLTSLSFPVQSYFLAHSLLLSPYMLEILGLLLFLFYACSLSDPIKYS